MTTRIDNPIFSGPNDYRAGRQPSTVPDAEALAEAGQRRGVNRRFLRGFLAGAAVTAIAVWLALAFGQQPQEFIWGDDGCWYFGVHSDVCPCRIPEIRAAIAARQAGTSGRSLID